MLFDFLYDGSLNCCLHYFLKDQTNCIVLYGYRSRFDAVLNDRIIDCQK